MIFFSFLNDLLLENRVILTAKWVKYYNKRDHTYANSSISLVILDRTPRPHPRRFNHPPSSFSFPRMETAKKKISPSLPPNLSIHRMKQRSTKPWRASYGSSIHEVYTLAEPVCDARGSKVSRG